MALVKIFHNVFSDKEEIMSAFIIVNCTPKDSDKLQAYSKQVPDTLTEFSGQLLAKGPVEVLTGQFEHKVQVVLQFPDQAKAKAWFESKPYQALTELREAAMDASFQLI